MTVIVDYGTGNVRSVEKAFSRAHLPVLVSSDPAEIRKADRIVLPGVGHFRNGMTALREKGVLEVLNEKVLGEKVPILGICLGMQLFTMKSEEGDSLGLGWIDAKTVRLRFESKGPKPHVPHVGWNTLTASRSTPLLDAIDENDAFYFSHSYHVSCDHEGDVLATSLYGARFTSVIHKGNIYGVQFHPEKSHRSGLQLIKNFVEKI